MIEGRASLTAATVALVVALESYVSHDSAIAGDEHLSETGRSTIHTSSRLQRDILLCMSRQRMFLPLWTLLQAVLCHAIPANWFRRFWQWAMGKTMQGPKLRKLYMEQQVRTFLQKQHAKAQVLILAAGYDTMAYRLAHEYPDVNFVEVDHPSTGATKIEMFQRYFAHKRRAIGDELHFPGNLYFCHIKLGGDAPTTLKGALTEGYMIHHLPSPSRTASQMVQSSSNQVFHANTPTMVVMEGLSFYLSEEENRSIFEQIDSVVGCPGTVMAFDYFHLDEYKRPQTKDTKKTLTALGSTFLKYKVKLFGEPFVWGTDPKELPGFFRGTNWRLMKNAETVQEAGLLSSTTFDCGPQSTSLQLGIEYEA
eukprot:CAMPEP_0198132830 /NCGR_PEP_ID=MMETSP1442-20131203/59164_1 /TAXON_ID= /ORGANISM="Craspedostauros australis, Strain CCMP3328" /LENGTH=365 /DNA_ID=CAMNT_0043793923 /DNA_START=33 /DNA_END=1126 /DNA_ORIENTATION=+